MPDLLHHSPPLVSTRPNRRRIRSRSSASWPAP